MHVTLVFPRATAAMVREHALGTVLAIDAGAEACLAAGIVPEAVVGDMDSVRPETLAELERRGARIERHPAAKRDTDAALALGTSQARGAAGILFLGAGGGRADHALANVHLLAEAALSATARAIDDDAETWIVTPERPLDLSLPPGAIVSAIPFDAVVEGVTYEGLAYPLEGALMRAGDPYGVSNVVLAGPRVRVSVTKGRLLVMRPLSLL